jgi:hypothetical protein
MAGVPSGPYPKKLKKKVNVKIGQNVTSAVGIATGKGLDGQLVGV